MLMDDMLVGDDAVDHLQKLFWHLNRDCSGVAGVSAASVAATEMSDKI
jgi:hypothetical protein